MLTRLYISNYALIDFLEIQCKAGLTSITGETGAGKSIILGALSLVLGKRADTSVLKNSEQKSIIEIEIHIQNQHCKPLFTLYDVDFLPQTTLRREITPQGKSRAFINDTPVSLQALKEIGESLIDIHSQHQNLLLRESLFQLQVVDATANNKELQAIYSQEFTALQLKQKELLQFEQTIAKHSADVEYTKFRYNELQQANLRIGELEEIEQEALMLEQGEEIIALFELSKSVFEGDGANLQTLKTICNAFQKKAHISKEFTEISERLNQSYIELSDIAREIDTLHAHFDFDPSKLDAIHSRIDQLHTLLHKYSVPSVEQLIAERDRLQEILHTIEHAQFDSKELQDACILQEQKVHDIAMQLHNSRKQAIAIIQPTIIEMLQKLGMPSVSFSIQLIHSKQLHTYGADIVEMKFSANKNIPQQALGEVSSGGELSRVMLCLKALISKSKSLQTIIFDEIDTGVSGEIADQMGTIMQHMAQHLQVLVISHLPQIAAKAQFQFKVFKEETSNTTTTKIVALTNEQRIEELAKMMSGKQITAAAIENAKHLLGLQ